MGELADLIGEVFRLAPQLSQSLADGSVGLGELLLERPDPNDDRGHPLIDVIMEFLGDTTAFVLLSRQ